MFNLISIFIFIPMVFMWGRRRKMTSHSLGNVVLPCKMGVKNGHIASRNDLPWGQMLLPDNCLGEFIICLRDVCLGVP